MSVETLRAGSVEERGVEEDGVALGQRELHVVLCEVLAELGQAPGEVPGEVLVGVGQVHRRPALHGHVGVGDRTLQRQHGRQLVHVGRVLLDHVVLEEPQVVVAVRFLRLSSGAYDVDLGGHLVARAEPGPGHQRDDVVGVVVDERPGVAHGQLLQRVPDAVVRAGLGEVVAHGAAVGALLGDDRVEGSGRPVDRCEVREGTTDRHDAGTVGQRTHELGGDHLLAVAPSDLVAETRCVVHQHVVHDVRGQREVGQLGALGGDADELVEVAVGGPQPRCDRGEGR